ncbi:MAG: phage tail assembly chaperone [Alphaproteobacteria bacterium]|nr:phage tail assembly chaperone [Alphaproteobacteria bacterium]
MLGFAIANLGMPARDFWRLSLREYAAAHKAWLKMQGFDEEKIQNNKMTKDDLLELRALVE